MTDRDVKYVHYTDARPRIKEEINKLIALTKLATPPEYLYSSEVNQLVRSYLGLNLSEAITKFLHVYEDAVGEAKLSHSIHPDYERLNMQIEWS